MPQSRWLKSQIRQDSFPAYKAAAKKAKASIRILKRPGERFRNYEGHLITVDVGHFWIAIEAARITEFWAAFEAA